MITRTHGVLEKNMSDPLRKIIIIGPQGSGKGTQAAALSAKFKIPHISSGEIFRKHINHRTPLGLKVRSVLEQGQLVPDDLTNQIIKERITKEDCQSGFILDGYPRNIKQAKFLEEFIKIEVVLEIWLADPEVIKRVAGRRVCNCGETYHLEYDPPKNENICDKCAQKIRRRDDESDQALKQRLAIYHQETEPLIEYYHDLRILIKVNGEPSIPQVTAEIFTKLKDKDFYQ